MGLKKSLEQVYLVFSSAEIQTKYRVGQKVPVQVNAVIDQLN